MTRSLSRIPVWHWYIFSVMFCYLTWNPSEFSLWSLLNSAEAAPSTKAISVVAWLVVASFYIVEGRRNFNLSGVILFLLSVGVILWFAFDKGFHGFNTAHLWGQWIIAAFLTLATQGGRIRRWLTGTVPVAVDQDSNTSHHGA